MKPFALATAAILLVAAVASVLLLAGGGASDDAAEPTPVAVTPGVSDPFAAASPAATSPDTPTSIVPGVRVRPSDVPDPFRRGETPPPGYRQLLARDSIRPVYDPTFVTAEAIGWHDQDLVLGLEIDGDARAYSIAHLNSHEMVIDRVAGIPVLVTW